LAQSSPDGGDEVCRADECAVGQGGAAQQPPDAFAGVEIEYGGVLLVDGEPVTLDKVSGDQQVAVVGPGEALAPVTPTLAGTKCG
jgi:hypothetical protein